MNSECQHQWVMHPTQAMETCKKCQVSRPIPIDPFNVTIRR